MRPLPLYMTDEQYLNLLIEGKRLVSEGIDLVSVDSDTIGDKYTHCTWGLCDKELEKKQGAIYRRDHHECPMDMNHKGHSWGCFFRCRVFSRGELPLPTREEVLAAYDFLISKVMRELG